MSQIEIILLAVGLSMDACAVAICKGLIMKQINWKRGIVIAIYFGFFQAIMPVIGYFLGIKFENVIVKIDHWIAFILLSAIGINMIKEALENNETKGNDSINPKEMVPLAIATSIDALAVGITFAFLRVNIVKSTFIIGVITFIISLLGVKLGNKFGDKYRGRAEIVGGITLITIAGKILLEHLT